MTTADQLTAIQLPQFFTDLRTHMQTIVAAMTTDSFTITGTIETSVNGVPVKAEIAGPDVTVWVGQDDNSQPLYTWHAPASWVS